MKNQWRDANTPTTSNLNYVLSQCGIFDRYIMYDTGEYEEQAMIWRPNGDIDLYTFTRTTSNYNSRWVVTKSQGDGTYSVHNELYVNGTDVGLYVAPPCVWTATCWASMGICGAILLSVVFPILFRKGCK